MNFVIINFNKVLGSRTTLSKYSVLSNKNLIKKNDFEIQKDKINESSENLLKRKENSKKININFAESIDQSDNSSTELDTEDISDVNDGNSNNYPLLCYA